MEHSWRWTRLVDETTIYEYVTDDYIRANQTRDAVHTLLDFAFGH